MTNLETLDVQRDASGGYKVDVSRRERIGRVSSEWFSRLDDERYLSLSELYVFVKGRAERSRTRTAERVASRVEAHRDEPENLALILPDTDAPVAPTHWSFGQLASLVSAPAAYLRQLSAPPAGINPQYGLTSHRAEQIKTLETEDGRTELRAVTRQDYGRIYGHELVAAVGRSQATEPAIRAGKCPARSPGRAASITRWSTSPRTRRRSTPRTAMSSSSWSMT